MKVTFEVEAGDETGVLPPALSNNLRDILLVLSSMPLQLQIVPSRDAPPPEEALDYFRSALRKREDG